MQNSWFVLKSRTYSTSSMTIYYQHSRLSRTCPWFIYFSDNFFKKGVVYMLWIYLTKWSAANLNFCFNSCHSSHVSTSQSRGREANQSNSLNLITNYLAEQSNQWWVTPHLIDFKSRLQIHMTSLFFFRMQGNYSKSSLKCNVITATRALISKPFVVFNVDFLVYSRR